MVALGLLLLCSCASSKKEAAVEDDFFKPLQFHWDFGPEDGDAGPTRDACVIKITASMMQQELVRQSQLEEISYRVRMDERLESLEFKGICEDPRQMELPECNWTASCSGRGDVVVKFHNER